MKEDLHKKLKINWRSVNNANLYDNVQKSIELIDINCKDFDYIMERRGIKKAIKNIDHSNLKSNNLFVNMPNSTNQLYNDKTSVCTKGNDRNLEGNSHIDHNYQRRQSNALMSYKSNSISNYSSCLSKNNKNSLNHSVSNLNEFDKFKSVYRHYKDKSMLDYQTPT